MPHLGYRVYILLDCDCSRIKIKIKTGDDRLFSYEMAESSRRKTVVSVCFILAKTKEISP
jgi:hypothetical protein